MIFVSIFHIYIYIYIYNYISIRISFFDLVVSESWGRSCVLGDTFLADLEIELKQEKKKKKKAAGKSKS